MLDIEETYVYDNYVYFVKFGKNKGGVDVMKRKLKLISLLLVVTLTIGLLDTQYYSDAERGALAADYENYVVNDMRDVHVYSKSRLEKFVDNLSYSEKSDKKIKAKAVKTIPLSVYKGINYTSAEDEEEMVVIENDIDYDIETGEIEVEVSCLDEETNEVVEETDVTGNVAIQDEYIIGTYEYNDEIYDLGEVMEQVENDECIDDCILPAILIGAIVGAAIGAVVGGVTSYVKYKEIRWHYVAGGAVIGGVLGAAAGWGVGYVGTKASVSAVKVASQCRKVSNCMKSKSAFKFTKTVLGHTERPYRSSQLLVKEIMKSATGVVDKTAANCYKWKVPGTMNKTKGVWELVVNTKTKTVVHFLFKK